jgi:hypothetical protein
MPAAGRGARTFAPPREATHELCATTGSRVLRQREIDFGGFRSASMVGEEKRAVAMPDIANELEAFGDGEATIVEGGLTHEEELGPSSAHPQAE